MKDSNGLNDKLIGHSFLNKLMLSNEGISFLFVNKKIFVQFNLTTIV